MTRPPPHLLIALLLGAAFLAADDLRVRVGAGVGACCLALAVVAWWASRRVPRVRDAMARIGAGSLPVRGVVGRFARVFAPLRAHPQPVGAREGGDEPPQAARGRGLRGDLVAVFAVALAVRAIWAVLVPPWLAPDEPDHYVYIAHLVEQGLPYPDDRRYLLYSVETSRSFALTLAPELSAGAGGTLEPDLPFFPVAHDYMVVRDYRGTTEDRRSAAGAHATPYPPLYYLYASLPYRATYDAPVLTRLYAVRLGSAVLGAGACVFGCLFAWEIRRSRQARQARQWGLALGLCMAFMPQHGFITASANNDAALFLFCTALCWLLARLWQQHRPAVALLFGTGVVMGLIVVTKPTGLGVLLTVAALALLWAGLRGREARAAPWRYLAGVGAGVAGLSLVSLPWLVYRSVVEPSRPSAAVAVPASDLAAWVGRLLGTVVVRAADPAAAVVASTTPRTYSLLEYLAVLAREEPEHWHWLFVRSFWGLFGWLDEPLPNRAYASVTVAVAIGLIGAAVALVFAPRHRAAVALPLALVVGQVGFVFLGADYFESFRRSGFALGLQGRYFLPVLAPLLLLLLSGWQYLLRDRPVGLRLAPLAMLALLLTAASTLLWGYYGVAFG